MPTSFTELAQETARLSRRLRSLSKQYPEEGMEPDERIFNRILTHDWRLTIGGAHGPVEERYHEAAVWVDSFDKYLKQLREHLVYGMGEPHRISLLPITTWLRIPSSEVIHLLQIQQDILARWAKEQCPSKNRSDADIEGLREKLNKLRDDLGAKALAHKLGCNRDTLNDFVDGRTEPHEKTLQKFRSGLSSL